MWDPYIYATHVTRLLCRSSPVWPAGELVGYECYIAPVGLLVHKLLTSQTPLTVGFFLIRTVYEIQLLFVFVVWCPQSFWSRLEFVIMVAWKPNNLCNTCFVKFRGDGARCIRGSAIIVLEVNADVVAYMDNSLLSVFPLFLSSLARSFCILFQQLFDFTHPMSHFHKFVGWTVLNFYCKVDIYAPAHERPSGTQLESLSSCVGMRFSCCGW